MTTIQIKVPNWLDFIFACPLLAYRLLRYGYSFRRIPLGEGKFTIVEQQDFYRFNIFKWCPQKKNRNIYVVRLAGDTKKRMKIISLHREIMNHPAGLLVDHRNSDGLDNRRQNLRLATKSQNTCNSRKRTNTSSQFVGVYLDNRRDLWVACIRYRGKRVFLGYFKNEIDAAKAYDAAAKISRRIRLFEFSHFNKVPTASQILCVFCRNRLIMTVGSISRLVKPVRLRSERVVGRTEVAINVEKR